MRSATRLPSRTSFGSTEYIYADVGFIASRRGDAEFIARVRKDVPALIAELRRRNEALATLLSIASDAVASLEEADYFATAAKLRDALKAFG